MTLHLASLCLENLFALSSEKKKKKKKEVLFGCTGLNVKNFSVDNVRMDSHAEEHDDLHRCKSKKKKNGLGIRCDTIRYDTI